MRRSASTICVLTLALTPSLAVPQTRVEVELDEPAAPRVDVPWLVVEVDGVEAERAASVRSGLLRDLGTLVHVRLVEDPAASDYVFAVRFGPTVAIDDGLASTSFEATLETPSGRRLWAARGSSRFAGKVPPDEAFVGAGRNLLDALVRGGWLRQRIDEDDPPPPPPALVRRPR